ncbi:RRP15-like protein isoform X1 [Erpetoichthys calabaricus]|uniref:RRP15-like protein n=1 Tax=Erpetoichthys calabaricus TaxID=27687 RepID=A0A8C4SQQ4_ERPCA|nr:RRP15-like protein isoform X1 [Erpetoichthys calabaricus]
MAASSDDSHAEGCSSSSEGCEYADDHDESPDQKSEITHEGVHNENIDASWAEAMAKILNKKTQPSKPTILLKNKELERLKEKEKQEQAEKQKKICERRDWELIGRVKPNIVQDREREKNLQRIATRGVVQLFNAVRKHQKNVDEKLMEAGGSERKKAKMLSSVTKKDFINVLRGNMSDNPHTTEKNKSAEIKNEQEPSWNILRDDFMMKSSMKDWDKEDDKGEDSNN